MLNSGGDPEKISVNFNYMTLDDTQFLIKFQTFLSNRTNHLHGRNKHQMSKCLEEPWEYSYLRW